MRALILFSVFFVPVAIWSAPPPKETESGKLKRLWGEPLDPEKDCKINLDGNRLRIVIPGTSHRFTPYSGHSEAPRIRREMTGDFTIQVKVLSVSTPDFKDDTLIMSAGGIYLGPNDETFVTLSRYNSPGADGKNNPQFLFQHRFPESTGSNLGSIDKENGDKPVYLRMEKEGNKVSSYSSLDGKKWVPRGQESFEWPEKLWVGVFASHSGSKETEGVFDEFVVTPTVKK